MFGDSQPPPPSAPLPHSPTNSNIDFLQSLHKSGHSASLVIKSLIYPEKHKI